MEHSPALTTNVEWGMWYDSGKAVLGYPYDAPHMKYLKHLAGKESVPVSHTLRETLVSAFRQIGSSLLDRSNFKEGEFLKKEYRVGGELAIPLHIWETPSFMAWRNTQVGAGNRIDDAKVVWTFRVGPNKSKVFFWALHVDVWIAAENRHKTNEIVLARPDISAIVGYCRPENKPLPSMKSRSYLLNTRVVIVREFRSPAVTTDCFIRELPGGSSWNGDESPVQVASHEFEEETGVTIPADRFRYLDSRQLIGTLSSHQAHVFAVELSPGEMEALAANRDPHGVEEDTERTYVEVYTVSELLNSVEVDWSNMGMLLSVLLRED
jgi:8-oxo-dGTP pyrophosphatase MutT (NUDIX family)